MDIKEYIASGILELYVLERLEPAHMREVEAIALEHPEIRTEIDQIEQALEAFAIAAAPEINPEILDSLLKKTAPKKGQASAASGTFFSWIPWLLAAAALAGLLYAYTQLGNHAEELLVVQRQMEVLQEDCDENQEVLRATQQRLNELTNPATQSIILAGTEHSSDKQAIVYYNPATNKTLFKAVNLPPPPAGKQYQLWAIDAGGPKDLGVLALNLDRDSILEFNHLHEVIAFAITLEDEGGKPTPDLLKLQVIGNVAG